MLPKEFRLNSQEIASLKLSAITPIQTRYFGVICVHGSESKIGIILSNKIEPLAVRRNQARRRFYRALSPFLQQLSGQYLFLAKKTFLESDEKQVYQDLLALFK